jgi:SAM-dependent methyltransferase
MERHANDVSRATETLAGMSSRVEFMSSATESISSLRKAATRMDARIERVQAETAAMAGEISDMRTRLDAGDAGQFSRSPTYAVLEDRLRGPREEIKRRLSVYLSIVRDAGAGTAACPVVDMGCGRGEWLELLREAGLHGRGVDSNAAMVQRCSAMGLDVTLSDATPYLKAQASGSAGAVSAFHLIEHLPLSGVTDFLAETYRVLQPGGLLLIETPNPRNLVVGAYRFWADPTHVRPIPEDLCEFLCRNAGFSDTKIEYRHALAADTAIQMAALQFAWLSLLDGAEFVTACYRHILGREPDAEGFEHFSALMQSGTSKQAIIESFVRTPEFRSAPAGENAGNLLFGPVDYGLSAFKREEYVA